MDRQKRNGRSASIEHVDASEPSSASASKTDRSEERLVASARSGDQRAFEQLAENYRRILEWHVSCIGVPESHRDDLLQEGLMGLLKAIRSYDGRSSSFATFASLCVRNSIISAVRKYNKQTCKTVFLPDDGEQYETVPSAEETIIDGERVRILYDKVYTALSAYEQTVFEMYLSDLSHDSIAFATGKSVKSTVNAIYRIRKKLRKIVGTP